MVFIEIKHKSEDIHFFKSLRSSNVDTDLIIQGKDGSVYVHRLVFKCYSSIFKKIPKESTKIHVKNADIQDLTSIVNFSYNGRCMVHQERIQPLLELATKLGFTMLRRMLEDIIETQNEVGDAFTVADYCPDDEDEERDHNNQARMTVDEREQKGGDVQVSFTEEGVANIYTTNDNELVLMEEGKPIKEPENEIEIVTIDENTEDMDTGRDEEEEDEEDESYDDWTENQLVKQCLGENPVVKLESVDVTKNEIKPEWIVDFSEPEGELVEEDVPIAADNSSEAEDEPRRRVSNHLTTSRPIMIWTKEQNTLFLELWLESLQSQWFDGNNRIGDEMAKAGVFVEPRKIKDKKWSFTKIYRKHLEGQNKPYIKDYLPLLNEIFKIKAPFKMYAKRSRKKATAGNQRRKTDQSTASSSGVSTPRRRSSRNSQKETGNDSVYYDTDVINESLLWADYDNDDDRLVDTGDEFIEIDPEFHTRAAGRRELNIPPNRIVRYNIRSLEKPPRTVGLNQRQTRKWSRKQNDIFLDYWLKYAQNELPDANKKVVEMLACFDLEIDRQGIVNRKAYLRTLYQKHIDGYEQPYIFPYLQKLQKIYEAEMNSTMSIDEGPEVGDRKWKAPPPKFFWTKEMIDVLMAVLLKYARRGVRWGSQEAVAAEVVDALAEKNHAVTVDQVVTKRDHLLRAYREHCKGQNHPSIAPYIPILKQIHMRLQK